MKRSKHIALFESFREDPRIGTPNPNAGFREGSNDYTRGVICIADMGGGGLAVGTLNSRSDAAYIQELEEFVPADNVYGADYASQISIDVFPNSGDGGEFVSFTDQQFNIHRLGETYRVTDNGFVFTIPNGSFLVLKDGYGQYELLTAKEVRDFFSR